MCYDILSMLTLGLCRAKRSWFANFRSEKDKGEEVVVVFRDKGFPDLRASLVQALKVSSISSRNSSASLLPIASKLVGS